MLSRILFLSVFLVALAACSDDDNLSGGVGADAKPKATTGTSFEQSAVGTWAGQACETQGGVSYTEILEIGTDGKGSVDYNVYNGSTDCQGQPTFQKGQEFKYTVDRFDNGKGQITVETQAMDIAVTGTNMSVTTAEGTLQYIKVK